jgi:heat shock protein HslJ
VRISLVLLVALSALSASACALRGDDNANGGLANTAWTVISIGGAATIDGAQPTMTFVPDGTVSGTTGCNQYSGSFRTDGDRITVVQMSSTAMMCEGDTGAQERGFTSGLSGATTWRLAENGNLELSGVTQIVAEPIGPDGPPETLPLTELPGTSWVLTEMGGTADFADIVPTLEFGGDGTVSGFAGCNTFNGTYTVDGAGLTFGPLGSTKIGCERPASAVETGYLGALAGVKGWTLADGRLVLDGPVPLSFGPG